jgi:hypothetical protein
LRRVGLSLAKALPDLCRADNGCACWCSLPRWRHCCFSPNLA